MNDPYILLRLVLASKSRALHRALLSSRAYAAVARVHRTQLVHALTSARPYPRSDGTLYWIHCDTGKFHREDGPAIENFDGIKEYRLDGKRHREDGPAIERAYGAEYWLNDKLHRVDGPAVEYVNGRKKYYINGKVHREDGPAVEWEDGTKYYWLDGKLHREDGPAIVYANGTTEYWLYGEKVTREEFEKRRKTKKIKLT